MSELLETIESNKVLDTIILAHEPYKTTMQKWYDERYEKEGEGMLDTLYKAYVCCEDGAQGDGYSVSHHSSLLRAMQCAILDGVVPKSLKSPLTRSFIEHMKDEYHIAGSSNYTYQKAEREVNELVGKLFPDGEFVPMERSADAGDKITDQLDIGFLTSFQRMSYEDIEEESSMSSTDMEAISPTEFLKTVFNERVLTHKTKPAFACVQAQRVAKASMFRYDDDPEHLPVNPYSGIELETIDGHPFVSLGVFKAHNKDLGQGKIRSLDNCVATPYVVFECDSKDEEIQERFNAFAMRVGDFAPLVAVVDSGGKSTHFWFAAHQTDTKIVKYFKQVAALCGADRHVLNTKVALVRLPNVKAPETGRRDQKLIYFNPEYCQPDQCPDWNLEGFEKFVTGKRSFEIYTKEGKYYKETSRNRWEQLTKEDLRLCLAVAGFSPTKLDADIISPVDSKIVDILENCGVDAVFTRVAGYKKGLLQTQTRDRFLVRQDFYWPTVVESKISFKKDCPAIYKYLKELFKPFELQIFLGWLSSSLKLGYNNNQRMSKMGVPAQALHIVGEGSIGKTLLIQQLLKPLFGGTVASAESEFRRSDFNSDLFESMLLVVDDSPEFKKDEEFRRISGEIIKSMLVATPNPMHGKFNHKVQIQPFWRFIRLLNYGMVETLPMISDPDVANKLVIIQAKPAPDREDGWAEEYKTQWTYEIDKFFTYLIRDHKIPKNVKPEKGKDRFPVISYIDPEIAAELDSGDDTLTAFLEIIENIQPTDPHQFDDEKLEGCYLVDGIKRLYTTVPQLILDPIERGRFLELFPQQSRFSKFLKDESSKKDSPILSTASKTMPQVRGKSSLLFAIPAGCDNLDVETTDLLA